jgi:hypothetical protein
MKKIYLVIVCRRSASLAYFTFFIIHFVARGKIVILVRVGDV